MMSRELPVKPNLEHLKKQAKQLLRDVRQGDAAAIDRFHTLPSFSDPASLKLADAQHLIAREYGFAAWPKLKEHVESASRVQSPAEMLSAAVSDGDSDRTARLLATYPELKAEINEPMAGYGGGMQALLAAVQRSDRKTIDVLLAAGADINRRSRFWAGGMGVLDECAPDMAAFLIERGAVLDAHSAARLGMFDELRRLVAANPEVVRVQGANGQTPLHFASTVEIARYLLEQGADIDCRDMLHESTPAQHMLRVVQARHYRHDRQQIARFLVARGCRADIIMAAALGDLDLTRRLLESGPDSIRTRVSEAYFPKHDPRSAGSIYNFIFGPDRTPHLVARDFGHEQVFQFLMERSPEDVKLSQAFELGDEDLFRSLLAARPNLVQTLSDEDRRRLPDAAQNNNTAALRLMLAAGWPVDATGGHGLTALQWASWHGNAEAVREILRYQPDIETNEGEDHVTALGCALHGSENSWHRQTGDYAATVEALLDAGAIAPKVTDDLEASDAVLDVLIRREVGASAETIAPPGPID
ncbi:MAG TPA: ankyrin repeat domain-containing protein [Blastocatellia bacterium]|nr:ankyrin repeat domain-containing protein [Blastocatellia bacterium]